MHSVAKLQSGRHEIAMPAKAGEMLFLEGEPCEHVYELRSGIARGISISEEGDRQVTSFFFAGDQIGLPVSQAYRFTAEAVTDLLFVRHSLPRWHEALIRSCREEGRLLPSICAEQDPVFRRGMILGRHGVLVRVCAFLVSIIDRLQTSPEGKLLLPLPQVDIAADPRDIAGIDLPSPAPAARTKHHRHAPPRSDRDHRSKTAGSARRQKLARYERD